MKRLFLISIFALLMAGVNYAQVIIDISGTVTDVNTGLPIQNQAVTIMSDSTLMGFFYYGTVYTDNNGEYEDSVNIPSNTPMNFYFYTIDCNGSGVWEVAYFSGNNNLNVDFQICSGAITNCTANFYAAPDSSNPAGGAYQFYNFSSGNITSYLWNFGDGTTSTLANPTHVYTANGLYYACLTIFGPSCQDSYCDSVWVGVQPCYNYFSYTNQGLSYSFMGYAYNGTPPYTYYWNFGDGTTATGSYVTHTYAQAGNYYANLTTTDANGCTYTSSQLVSSFYLCYAAFNAYPDSTGNGVLFIDQSMTNPASWSWNFGDNSTSNQQNPYHIYAAPGTYNVCLTITGLNGCFDSQCQMVTVSAGGNCSAYYYSYPDTTGTNAVYFQEYSTGNVSNYSWDFGDGNTSTLANPQHVYATSGSYYVCLTIYNNLIGCQDTFCSYVTVGNSSFCQAYFYAFPDSANPAGGNYQFMNASVGSPTTYSWSFGDGGVSSLENPTHFYTANGYYMVCLTIFGANCQSTWCDTILVGPQPCSNYFVYNSLPGMMTTFAAFSMNGVAPITYTWDFGDGTTATGDAVTHNYTIGGYYMVTLTSVDANGCSATTLQYVYAQGGSTGYVYGQVTANNIGLDEGIVVLYTMDFLTNQMYPVDSTTIDSAGYYWFNNVLPGTYFIKAYPTANSAFYSTYAPTYFMSSLFWANATAIVLGSAANPYNISLLAIVPPSPGGGSISGIISEGAKLQVQGPAVPNVEIMLLSMSNQVFDMVYSDAAGQFSFTNLAMGTYQVYAEVTGLSTVPYIVTLTNNNPTNNNVNLLKTPNGITMGLSENPAQAELSVLRVYPNPAKDIVTLSLESAKPGVLTAELFDLTGKKVMTESINIGSGKAAYKLYLNNLHPGFYTLTLTSEKGVKTTQKLTLIP